MKNNYALMIFIAVLTITSIILLIGIDNPIIENHKFRQTQTAITAYYFVENGFQLDYITPVLGKPWAIPLEFPIYQYLVSFFTKQTGVPLDKSGRLVSIFFFLMVLYPLSRILKILKLGNRDSLIILSFMLVNPLLIFWSRTFLIESITLFFSVVYVSYSFNSLSESKKHSIYFAIIFGILAALSKLTIWTVFVLPILYFLIYSIYPISLSNIKKKKRKLVIFFLLVGIPFISTLIWNIYASRVREENIVAQFVLSTKTMLLFNFGTLSDRLNPITWIRIISRINFNTSAENIVFFRVIFILFIIAIIIFTYKFMTRKSTNFNLRLSVLSLSVFFFGPIVFTHLYYVHGYYLYESILFISLAVGFFSLYIKEKYHINIVFIILFIFMQYGLFFIKYYKIQTITKEMHQPYFNLMEDIQTYVPVNKSILVLGNGWSSDISYYSERKSLTSPLTEKQLIQLMLDDKYMFDDIEGVIVNFRNNQISEETISKLVALFHLNNTPLKYKDKYTYFFYYKKM